MSDPTPVNPSTIQNKYPSLVPDEILESAKIGHFVVFVGAGVSRIIGGASWAELAVKHLDFLFEENLITFAQKEILMTKYVSDPRRLLTICNQIENKSGDKKFDFSANLKFDEGKRQLSPIYDELYKWKAAYVTTNYDSGFDDAVMTAIREKSMVAKENSIIKKEGHVFYKVENFLNVNLDQGKVLYLHGSAKETETMVVTLQDYINRYRKSNEFSKFLKQLFADFTVLFVGYSLAELEILEYLLSMAK